jgi:GDP-L-fucose synthase
LGHAGLIPESALLSGPLEPTNEGYALSKIVGLKLARYYWEQHGMLTVCPMLSNVYGTGDHFDLARAHVLSSLVRRFVDARDSGAESVILWGTGVARREFLHSEDAARAILFFMDHVDRPDHINVGLGTDVTIRELAGLIAQSTGFRGEIGWDATKPDGMLRKCLDTSLLHSLGFSPQVSLDEGIRRTIVEYETIKRTGAQTS